MRVGSSNCICMHVIFYILLYIEAHTTDGDVTPSCCTEGQSA